MDFVRDFYDRRLWLFETTFGGSIHQGVWDGDVESLTEAQDRLTDELIGKISLRPGERLLDLGSGTGRPAVRLALASGAEVEGINLSGSQNAVAVERAFEAGVVERVRFTLGDFRRLPYPDAGFDAAWVIEGLFHVPDRPAVLNEVFRVLRGGARLALAEITVRSPMRPELRHAAWGLAGEPSRRDYLDLLRGAGFEVLDAADESDRVADTMLCWQEELAVCEPEIVARLGPEFTAGLFARCADAALLQKGVWGYATILARKPGSGTPTGSAAADRVP